MNNNISDKDKKDWQKFINSNEKLPNKDSKNKKQNIIKTKSIDLHGCTLEEANVEIKKFIISCYNNSVKKLIVVTGKGLHSNNLSNPYKSKDLSILKYSVPEFIKNDPQLMNIIINITEANIEDGGSGSFYIYLTKKK
ncbi:Smr/MutS family protein [Candidatus Pelagibacter sp. FZCC0015]|uniref:Smr/MutS family protein n=1 Tax=Candidatus Pelagibacter sp. FZCC0015 TaxID=2268451 RepID=UPI00119D711A|nr:Smr/MutS family protein [Candidatus Pelagibacter sp. FZCC0015]